MIGPGYNYAFQQNSLANEALVVLFLLGIFLGVDLRVAQGLPVPTVIAGIAGIMLLLINSNRIDHRALTALALVISLYSISILFAEGYGLLGERFKGLIQITYSLVIGYGLFIALLRFSRDGLARLLLVLASIIVIGCILESHTMLRNISDAFRHSVFDVGVYESDLRDEFLYGGIRPKLFTSEPSYVAFAYTLFLFAWYVLSRWPLKLAIYLLYLAAGLMFLRSPTLIIGAILVLPYEFLLAARRDGPGGPTYDAGRIFGITAAVVLFGGLLALLAQNLFTERLDEILSGRDSSFFGRIVAPALAAREILLEHPIAGAGLAGWEFIDPIVQRIYASSWGLTLPWVFGRASDAVTNYFWSHWIFLGLFWGTVLLAALSGFARTIGMPSLTFTWVVWFAFGNAVGSYVSPRTWTVFFLAGAVAMLHQREAVRPNPYPAHRPARFHGNSPSPVTQVT